MTQKPTLKLQNGDVSGNNTCCHELVSKRRLRYGALAKKILLKLSVRVEVSSVESNETTAATVSCDLAPPPQRWRRRHPPLAPPPRNLPFVTLPDKTGLGVPYHAIYVLLVFCT